MKNTPPFILATLALLVGLPQAHAQTTAFTYSGRLLDGGGPATGTYDLRFALYDSTNQIGATLLGTNQRIAVAVSNGLFMVALDFGANPFSGWDCWPEIHVRTNGSLGPFQELSPRQQIMSAPYAIFARTASNIVNGAAPLSIRSRNNQLNDNHA